MNTKKKRRMTDNEEFKESEDLETEDIYEDDQRDEMLKEDEITAAEDAFMRGREITPKKIRRFKRPDHEDTVSVELAEDDYNED